jgi:hypothetical protein
MADWNVDKQRVIEWLCTPKRDREPQRQEDLAKELGVSANTVCEWKRDADFLRAWETHYLATVGSPERKQTVLDTLYRTGTDADDPRHVQAAAKYMELVEGLKPQRLDVHLHRPAQELSEEQLDEILARHAERERGLRLVDEAS